MPEPTDATRQGAALDTITHGILAPVLFVNFGVAIWAVVHFVDHRLLMLWLVVMAISLILLNIKTRVYTLRIQDRVIRLEERLRYAALLPPGLLANSAALDLQQIIALRFASDAELPALMERTLAERLTQKQIKENIHAWRADNARV